VTKKKEEEKEVIQFMINTPMLTNWVQIKITKTFFQNHTKIDHKFFNYNIFPIFYVVETFKI